MLKIYLSLHMCRKVKLPIELKIMRQSTIAVGCLLILLISLYKYYLQRFKMTKYIQLCMYRHTMHCPL